MKELLEVGLSFAQKDRELLESLQQELDRAHIVEPTAIPHDVVTMNSRVRLRDLESSEDKVCTLVFPSEADLSRQKISVLAPIGTAILGYRTDETVEWRVSAGVRKLPIEEILFQPEAEGHYRL